MLFRVFCAVLLLLGHFTVVSAEEPKQDLVLKFGLYQSDKATEMYRKFNPVIEAMQVSVAESLGRPVKIDIRIFKTYQEAQDALVSGEIDFARFGPVSYILAKNRNSHVGLLAMENKKGGRSFRGVIAVRADSHAQSLADLKGQSFAFGDSNSTIGRYLAQAELLDAGISGDDLKYEYLGRHDMVAKAVALGDFQAGALKESTFKKTNKNGQLRVLIYFENVTKPWPVRAGLSEDIRAALEKALIGMKNPEALKKLKVDGFFPGEDHYYDAIRSSIEKVKGF